MHDVIIIGGGPAGSTAAARLAAKGHDVLLLEKEKFPREHVGESLLPFCYPLFEELGVLDQLKKRFVRKPGVRFIDRDGKASTTWCFDHVIKDATYLSFQVIRTEFDQLLLKNAERLGAKVCEETWAKDVDTTSDPDSVTVESLDVQGNEKVHRARFLIDASGREAFLGAKHGWRKHREELDRTALWSHWDGVKLSGGLEEGLSMIVYMGEEQKGWIWVFPLGGDRVTAGMVTQNSYIRSQRTRLQEEGSADWKQDLCLSELKKSGFVAGVLEGARQVMPIQVNANYSYEVHNHYGTNYAMIGDARGFIDPIFSSGVFLSMKTAFLVSSAVDNKLKNNLTGINEDMVTAYKQVTGAYGFVHRMIKMFYNPHAITWAQAGAEGQIHKAHESALAAGHYMLSGDFFENFEKYHRFFELLEEPKNFQRYKKIVIDRADFNETSCGTPWETVFAEMADYDRMRKQALMEAATS